MGRRRLHTTGAGCFLCQGHFPVLSLCLPPPTALSPVNLPGASRCDSREALPGAALHPSGRCSPAVSRAKRPAHHFPLWEVFSLY